MRWHALFEDLEAQFALAQAASHEAEMAERAEAEWVRICLLDRLRPGAGQEIGCLLTGGTRLSGAVLARGANWFALGRQGRVHLIRAGAIGEVSGLSSGRLAPRSATESRLALTVPLRRLASMRAGVAIDCGPRMYRGVIRVVGADHLDLAARAGTLSLPLDAIEALSTS